MTSSTRAFPTVAFQGLVIFNVYVTSITGSKKLTPEDLNLKASDFPPEELATLGSIHTCDPKSLQPFESKRNAMRNACLEFGTQVRGQLCVPETRAHQCADKLDTIVAEFYSDKAKFIQSFSANSLKWRSRESFQKWATVIAARVPTVAHLEKQIQCGWHAYRADITGLPKRPGEDASSLGQNALKVSTEVADSALQEVAVSANAILRDSLTDDKGEKTEVTQKILSPIRRIRDKLDSLSFADPKLVDVVKYINGVFAMLPQTGKMSGTHLAMIRSLVVSLCDPESIAATAAFARREVTISAEASQQILDMVHTPSQEVTDELQLAPVEDDVGSTDNVPTAAAQTSDAPESSAVQSHVEQGVIYDDL